MASGINSFALLAIPFFILAGVLMGEGGMARALGESRRAAQGGEGGGRERDLQVRHRVLHLGEDRGHLGRLAVDVRLRLSGGAAGHPAHVLVRHELEICDDGLANELLEAGAPAAQGLQDGREAARAIVPGMKAATEDDSTVVWTPLLPGYSWHPTRSYLMRVERGNPVRSITNFCGGRPTVRKAESRGGNRTPKKRMPAAERKQENEIMRCTGPSRRWVLV